MADKNTSKKPAKAAENTKGTADTSPRKDAQKADNKNKVGQPEHHHDDLSCSLAACSCQFSK